MAKPPIASTPPTRRTDVALSQASAPRKASRGYSRGRRIATDSIINEHNKLFFCNLDRGGTERALEAGAKLDGPRGAGPRRRLDRIRRSIQSSCSGDLRGRIMD